MHEDHDVSRRARRKDTLSAEDLGILLQWHWKYGMSAFTNERQRVQMSLLMLFSAFTGSRPATLLADDQYENDFAKARRFALLARFTLITPPCISALLFLSP